MEERFWVVKMSTDEIIILVCPLGGFYSQKKLNGA